MDEERGAVLQAAHEGQAPLLQALAEAEAERRRLCAHATAEQADRQARPSPTRTVTPILTLTLALTPTPTPTPTPPLPLPLQAERGRLEQCAAALRARVTAAEQSNAQLAHGLHAERAQSEALRQMDRWIDG